MFVTNDFWLQLHRLSGCLEAEGGSRRERLANVIAAWEAMPQLAREQVAEELAHLLDELPELREMVRKRLPK
jgi:hypothetical protein